MDRSSISTFSIQSSTEDSETNWKREPSEDAEIFPADLSGDEGKQNKEKLNKGQKSSLQGVVINIVNTAVGCGVIGLPYVIRQLGVVLGAIVLTLGAMVLYICSNILQKTKNLSRHSNYVTIAQHCFPKNGYNLLAVTLIINNLGSCVVYLSIFSTVAQNLAETFEPSCAPGPFTPFLCRKNVLIALGGALVLPFNFLKSFDKMEIAGFFKILSMGLFTLITFGYFVFSMITGTASTDIDIFPSFKDPIGMLACVTQVPLAYNFLFNQFSIYKSMKNATDANMDTAVATSIGVVGMIYSTIAMSGYAIFGTSTDNVLKNFTIDQLGSFLFIVLNVSFLVASLMTYPPTYFSPRNIIYNAIMNRMNDSYVNLASKDHKEESGHAKLVYFGVVCLTNLIIVILAISAPGVNELFGLIGSLATVGLIFIFPPTFYLVLSGRRGKQRGTAIAMLILGSIMGVTGLIANLYKIVNG